MTPTNNSCVSSGPFLKPFTQTGRCSIIDIITPKEGVEEGVELEAEVTRQANDVIMKAMAGTFKDKTLKIFGLNTPRIEQA